MNNNFEIYPSTKSISSICDFCNFKSSIMSFKKDGLFIRFIGVNDKDKYLDDISSMDKKLIDQSESFKIGYLRLKKLDICIDKDELSLLESYYNNIISSYIDKDLNFSLPFELENPSWNYLYKKEFLNLLNIFSNSNQNISDTILKNFIIKILHWINLYFPKLFLKTKVLSNFPKFVLYDDIKLQEYLFLSFLYSIGCDILYLNPKNDIKNIDFSILSNSILVSNTTINSFSIPEFNSCDSIVKNIISDESKKPKNNTIETPTTVKELEYVELAKLASSVVKIYVYNEKDEVLCSGSGVFINKKGYILTNFHVVFNGHYYGIQLEDNDELIFTNELTKYHQNNDLALLNLNTKSIPIPISKDSIVLVRGQKIVTIGSPLGLFNTISDGIISGFRVFGDRNMIQISAPISPGSSGGALLDLYGNLIGITTAGMDEGQNLNLAISYEDIYSFVSGFLTEKFFD